MKRYTVEDLLNEQKKAQANAKWWLKRKKEQVLYWYDNNRDVIIVLGPAVMGAVTTGVKVVGKHVNLHKEKNVKDLYCYDRSLGHYWALRRELTNKEWVEIDKRKKNGERLADILSEMKVLK